MASKPQEKQAARVVDYHDGSGVPVHFYLDDQLMPDDRALKPLEELSQMPEVDEHIVALPDLHYKSRNIVPTGLVTVSKDHIIPFAVDKGINCGIRMMTLPLSSADMPADYMDRFYGEVMKRVPVSKHKELPIDEADVKEIAMTGAEWAQKKYDIPDEDMENYEKRGNLFRGSDFTEKEILHSIPEVMYRKGRRNVGVLGSGNHFLELQRIGEVVDASLAAKLGLAEDQLVLMLHTGTGGFGGSLLKYFHRPSKITDPKKVAERLAAKKAFHDYQPLDEHRQRWMEGAHLYGIPVDSPTARHFLGAVNAVANFGFVNRATIAYHAENVLREIFGSPDLRVKLLYDSSHVTIQQENHNGKDLWVHRNGANQANPASYMSDHPVFKETGQPIPVPGSMGTDSYIAVAAEGARHTFSSTNHGAGRLLDKPEAREAFGAEDVVETMNARGIRLYRYGKGDINEQAPDAFKNIDNVLRVMELYDIANPVVRVSPLATLKG